MNILVIPSWYPNKLNSFKGIFIKKQVDALSSNVCGRVVVLYPFDECQRGSIPTESIEDGVITYRCNTDNLRNRYISRIKSTHSTIKIAEELIKKHNIDVIHAQVGYPAGIIAYYVSKMTGVPYFITEHMSYLGDYVSKFYHRFFLKRAFENASYVITVSRALQKDIENFGFKCRFKTIYNVVDTDIFRPYNTGNHGDGTFRLLFIGLLDPKDIKGLEYLLPAFANALQKYKNMKLCIVGDGPARQKYESMCAKLGIEKDCLFMGLVDNKKMPDVINNCSALVLSSRKETFGCVLAEAMACGKPVIATRCGGPEEFVTEKVGILVEKQNIESLQYGIQYMVENYNKFDNNYIRNYAVENFGSESIGSRIIETYKK